MPSTSFRFAPTLLRTIDSRDLHKQPNYFNEVDDGVVKSLEKIIISCLEHVFWEL